MGLRRLMICALCLSQGRPLTDDHPDDPRHRAAAGGAITILGGRAICAEHWRQLHAPTTDQHG